MCGIAGIVGAVAASSSGRLAATMSRRLEHRGPDDHGWMTLTGKRAQRGRGTPDTIAADAVLLHRRLAILDRSEAGWQPMSTADDRHFLVFNGEIYNYLELRAELQSRGRVFHSNGDTEVLLHALAEWGTTCLPRLVGMFAFAWLDVAARRLVLARDCFGIKPLYYTRPLDSFAFASEIKPLLEVPGASRDVNPQRLFDFLRFGRSDHGGDTCFADIRQLPAAHYLVVSLDQPEIGTPVRYWQVDGEDCVDISHEEATRRLRDLFVESIRLHLRSDVPIGAALSGGIDSSAIVGVMRAVAPKLDLHAFTYVCELPELNESRWAEVASASANAALHFVDARPEELFDDLDALIDCQEEPFGSTSIYAQHRVFRAAREAGIPVMLDGQGADELLGGYRSYLSVRLASLLRRGHLVEASRFLARASKQPGAEGSGRMLLGAAATLSPPALRRIGGETRMPRWLNARWFQARGVRGSCHDRLRGPDLLRAQLQRTLVETSLPMLLRYEDRNSMANSVESRVPFLTPALASFVHRLPEEYLIAEDGTSKSVFRAAMRGLVPDAVLDRKDKVGFQTPEKAWLQSMGDWAERILSSEAARRIPALCAKPMREEWHLIREGKRPFDFRVWRWINVVHWAERFDIRFAA
jgi:asparagine synthase (glutamine-hydrolysing)